MKTPHQKKGVPWLLIVLAVAVGVVLLATVPDNPGTEAPEETVAPAGDDRPEEPEPMPSEPRPAETTKPPEMAIQPPPVAEPQPELPTERELSSTKPLYFRVVFGEGGTDSTLGVVDESGGDGKGYDVAYVDENRNGDLTDDGAKKFPTYDRGSRAGQVDPTFTFSGPLKDKAGGKYSLNLYTLGRRASATTGDQYFFWTLDTDGWNYFFINGKARLSSSAADALAGPPIRLAGPCKWQIESKSKSGKAMVSAGLKDENGCTLRSVRKARERPSPRLILVKNGKVELEEDMKFG